MHPFFCTLALVASSHAITTTTAISSTPPATTTTTTTAATITPSSDICEDELCYMATTAAGAFISAPCPAGYNLTFTWTSDPAAVTWGQDLILNAWWMLAANTSVPGYVPEAQYGRGLQVAEANLVVCNTSTAEGQQCPNDYTPNTTLWSPAAQPNTALSVSPIQRVIAEPSDPVKAADVSLFNYTATQTFTVLNYTDNLVVVPRMVFYDSNGTAWMITRRCDPAIAVTPGVTPPAPTLTAEVQWTVIVVISIGLLIAICIIAILFVKYRRLVGESKELRLQKYPRDKPQASSSPSALDAVCGHSGPLPRNTFIALEQVGQGEFGSVYKGAVFYRGQAALVAIKTLKPKHAEMQSEFEREAEIMKRLSHEHIVRLVGVVEATEGEPLCLLMEFMPGGNLLNHLRASPGPPSLREALWYAQSIAQGMQYLASQCVVHRDLAARNCMLGAPTLHSGGLPVVKISDFGLARAHTDKAYYQMGGDELLPLRWLAVEAMTERRFTQASDGWAFAVTVWEILTGGEVPYTGLQTYNLAASIALGLRLPCPHTCPPALYSLMASCWHTDPSQRPTFTDMVTQLETLSNVFSSASQQKLYEIENPYPSMKDVLVPMEPSPLTYTEVRSVVSESLLEPPKNPYEVEISVSPMGAIPSISFDDEQYVKPESCSYAMSGQQ